MRLLIPLFAMFSMALLTGCATSTPSSTADTPAHTCCQDSPSGTCVDCPACAAGEKCEGCEGQCQITDAKACATCASGEHCAECAAKKEKQACSTCAAGETCTECEAEKTEPAESATDAAETGADVEAVATIDAKGMGCPLCASNIDRRMQKLDGINWTKIDLGKGQVMVGLDPSKPAPTAEQLQQAVNDAGFTAGDVTLPADGAVQ
jgi:copper chaperone CopZ